jgi:hypothetical protein
MHDGVTNMYFFLHEWKTYNFCILTPKQIYEKQQKLKKQKMVEKESLYIKGTFFANKVLLGFHDDAIL